MDVGVFIFIPIFQMGQYFKAVNKTKHEYICPWCMGGGAKLWEWSVNPQGAIFTLLLRQSSATGGGDYQGPEPQIISADDPTDLAETIARGVPREGQPVSLSDDAIVGRWAGDAVCLVGDYDASELYDKAGSYRNITPELIEVWNQFVGIHSHQLRHHHCLSCSENDEE